MKATKAKPLEIEVIETHKLVPYAKNSRTHSKEQITQIATSIEEFGFTNPVLIGESEDIIAGHGRVMAAKELELSKVPCIRLKHLTEEQKKAYVIADNKLALNAGWDENLLKQEIESLQESDYDISLTGFSEMEIDELLAAEEIIDEADEILHEQSLQVEPAKEYVLILAKDIDEWDELVEYFQLKKVRRGGYKAGSAFDSIGTERVLKFERVKNANSNSK
nr:plasmid partitioning protein ParB [uncultured Mediterranean phage uvMED]